MPLSASERCHEVTLLIAFLSLTNIALGYGLAIYLGHAQPFWKAPARPSAPRKPVGRSADRRQPIPQSTSEDIAAEQPPAKPPTKAMPKPAAPELPTVNTEPESTGSIGSNTEETSLEDTLKDLEAFREQVHEQQNPPSIEESLAEDSESDDSEESAEADAEDMGEDDLMKGIGAFQDQLKRQQELSKIAKH